MINFIRNLENAIKNRRNILQLLHWQNFRRLSILNVGETIINRNSYLIIAAKCINWTLEN